MSEDTRGLLGAQEEMMRRLKSIGADLWGGLAGGPGKPGSTASMPGGEDPAAEPMTSDIEEAWRQEMRKAGNSAGARPGAARAEKTAAPRAGETDGRPQVRAARPKTSLENLWITADETVDWTEALLRETPRDGLTGQKRWNFYHRMAPRVLEGNLEAYAEVLTTANPLGDLTEYVTGMVIRTPGADRLECVFECQPDDLETSGERYLAGLSLRIARDLLAVLPVSEVHVCGKHEGQEKIRVLFRRDQLLKRKMAFVDPAELVRECGGEISA